MTDPGKETRLVDVKGRSIVVKKLTDAQMIIMARDASVIDSDTATGEEKLQAAGFILDMFETAIVQADDRAYALQLARLGQLELTDFMGFLSAFQDDMEPAAPAKPVVRRGRPRKAQQ